MQPTTPSDTEDGWSAEMMAAKEKLLALGAAQDEVNPFVFWVEDMCFLIESDGQINELYL
jgi:hypothetical protein